MHDASAGSPTWELVDCELPSGEAVRGDRLGDLFCRVGGEALDVLDPAEAFFTTDLLSSRNIRDS